jgi:hypothetical protein
LPLVLLALATALAPGIQARTTLRAQAPAPDILALAWLDPRRLVALRPDSVALVRLDGDRATLEAEEALPGPRIAVRKPGGLIAGPAGGSVWVMTSRAPRAVLFDIERRGLRPRSEAEALPWPGVPGLRFRLGTNLIEGALGDHPGPFVAVAPGAAVAADGTLLVSGMTASELRAGNALALLWPGWLVTSSNRPPAEEDALVVVSPDRVAFELKVAGSVSALAARVEHEKALVAVATPADLLVVELSR